MAETICDRGHKFDSSEGACPHCRTKLHPDARRHRQQDGRVSPPSGSFVLCPRNHKYDEAVHDRCPQCERDSGGIEGGSPEKAARTRLIRERENRKRRPPVRAWLVVTDGPLRHQDYAIREGRNVIGASKHCDVIIRERASGVLDTHAIIRIAPNDSKITDCDTGGATHVDGVECIQERLRSGASVRLGDLELTFRCFSSVE